VNTLNQVYSSLTARRRYEVWFIRVGLSDGSGAWWFRYLLINPGRSGCTGEPRGMPVQVWATWFPRDGKPQSFIQGFPLAGLNLSGRGQNPFYFQIGQNEITEDSCKGRLEVGERTISWDMRYHSAFRVTVSNKGWIGFSRTPHSDAVFSGQIMLDGESFRGDPLGFGVQGHNCGYRHRNFWTWTHAHFRRLSTSPSTLEALVYEMPFGLLSRKAVFWHDGKQHEFRNLQEIKRDSKEFGWSFRCALKHGFQLEAAIDGAGPSVHHLPYMKTDCTGSFEVTNNSLARAVILLKQPGGPIETLETSTGAVLERAGR
jgi:hypothetical protein